MRNERSNPKSNVQCPKSSVLSCSCKACFAELRFLAVVILTTFYFLLTSSSIYGAFSKGDAGSSGVQFLKMGAGARYNGMGGIGVGVSGDASSVYWNVAGLSMLEGASLSIMHAIWFEDIGYTYAGYGQPIENVGVIGIGLQYLSYGSIKGADDNGVIGSNFSPTDMSMTVGYSSKVGDEVSLGVGVKYISSKIKESGSAFAGDVGLLYKPMESEMSIGISVQNVGSEIKYVEEGDSLPMVIRIGGGYNIQEDWLIGLEVTSPNDNSLSVGVGSEYKYLASEETSIVGRVGYNTRTKDIGGLKGLSIGAGLWHKGYEFDYAFVPFGDLGSTHQVSLNIKF